MMLSGACAIERDERGERRRRSILNCVAGASIAGGKKALAVEVTDAAQIALAFFADIGNEEQRHGGNNAHS